MDKKQIDRLNELDQTAVNRYLDKTDFAVENYLEIDEQEEYCKLYNMQFEQAGQECVCGKHDKFD